MILIKPSLQDSKMCFKVKVYDMQIFIDGIQSIAISIIT